MATHALVLRFVFPGYYRPFWPFHSDFYIASELANTPSMPAGVLRLPRPVGYLWFYLTGQLGVRGAIAANLLLLAANLAGTILCVRRMLGVARGPASWAAAFVYLFLVFAHPGQYSEALYDPFSQVAYGLMLIGLSLGWRGAPASASLAFLLALLAKETFAPAVLVMLAAIWLSDAGPGRRQTLSTAVGLVAAGILAGIYSGVVKSEYLDLGAGKAAPYFIDLHPASVFHEWTTYAAEAGPAFWAYIAIAAGAACFVLAPAGRKRWLPMALVAAGLSCWLPNSVLPNHRLFGYSWLGASLLLAPILTLANFWAAGRKGLFTGLMVLGLLVPAASKAAYVNHAWLLQQQQRQAKLMRAIGARIATLPPGTRSVLVTGLNFPFSPFDHPRSLYRYSRSLPMFSVVIYEPKEFTLIQKPVPARWIAPEQASKESFDQVWAFDEDGSAARISLTPQDRATLTALGVDSASLPLYPAVAIALGLDQTKPGTGLNVDGLHLLGCGGAYVNYHRYAMAMPCLLASAAKLPDNPYPHYFLGVAEEKLAHVSAAQAEFSKAIALDDKTKPNPIFRDALARVGKDASPQ